jgi:IS4 transposase
LRRITIRLKTATRDGDKEIHVLTNLPSKVSAVRVASLYRQRWTLEQAFNELTTHLPVLNHLERAAYYGKRHPFASYRYWIRLSIIRLS